MADTSNTLIVRHIPSELNVEERVDLLKHFGAASVRCMSDNGPLRLSAFATFGSSDEARDALSRLHQLDVLVSKLVAEFAKDQQQKFFPLLGDIRPSNLDVASVGVRDSKGAKEKEAERVQSAMLEFYNRLHIGAKFGIEHRRRSALQYCYPAPTISILTNICHALASVPKFYTQVLHLMNKMDLPAPFGPVTPGPELPYDHVPEEEVAENSSEESEIDDDGTSVSRKGQAPVKRNIVQKPKSVKKLRLGEQIALIKQKVDANVGPAILPSEVFELPSEGQGARKIAIRVSAEFPTRNEASTTTAADPDSGFGKFEPEVTLSDDKQLDETDEQWTTSEFISLDELKRKQLPGSECDSHPAFRNYASGDPTSRLYLKNLAKHTTEQDLHYIYGRYISHLSDIEKEMFDIRLMKEGRMKGQAFITLHSEETAKKALQDTNGYILHDRPIVVQFARSAKAKSKDDGKKS